MPLYTVTDAVYQKDLLHAIQLMVQQTLMTGELYQQAVMIPGTPQSVILQPVQQADIACQPKQNGNTAQEVEALQVISLLTAEQMIRLETMHGIVELHM